MKNILLIVLSLLPIFLYANDKIKVTAYSYHVKPPLVINEEHKVGLYFDVIQYLNTHSQKFTFELVFIPRKRIERMLQTEGFSGLILGVNPIWFNDREEQKYLWTARIFTDRDEIVSLNSTSFEYMNTDSLKQLTFGGVRGFYYFGISESIQSGHLKHVETANEIALFGLLLNRRIDAAVISRSTFDYMVKNKQWYSKFYLSKKPHDIYDRRLLFPKNSQAVYKHVSAIVQDMQFDENWLSTISQYR